MSKRFLILMIFNNLLLDVVYIVSSVHFWDEMNKNSLSTLKYQNISRVIIVKQGRFLI